MRVDSIVRSDMLFGYLTTGDVFCTSEDNKRYSEAILVKVGADEAMFLSTGHKILMQEGDVVFLARDVNVEVHW